MASFKEKVASVAVEQAVKYARKDFKRNAPRILNLVEKFDVKNDPNEIIIDFKESKITDMSAIDAVNKITGRYAKLNKTVHLQHLSSDCRILLKNADTEIDVNILEDPTYKIVGD